MQSRYGVPDVAVAGVKRREAESQNIGRSKIANHASGYEGLHEAPRR